MTRQRNPTLLAVHTLGLADRTGCYYCYYNQAKFRQILFYTPRGFTLANCFSTILHKEIHVFHTQNYCPKRHQKFCSGTSPRLSTSVLVIISFHSSQILNVARHFSRTAVSPSVPSGIRTGNSPPCPFAIPSPFTISIILSTAFFVSPG